MSSTIALNGIGISFPNPGVFAQINFASGPIGGNAAIKKVLLIGNGTGSPAATQGVVYGPDTATVMQQESDAIALFNAGSNLHTMYRRFTQINKNTPVYAVMVTADTGAAATGTITFTTTSTALQTVRVWVEDQFVDTTINVGDTVTGIAGNVVNNINAQYWWPVSATNTAGVITLTAKTTGLEGNAIFVQAQIMNGNGVTSVSPTANTRIASTSSGTLGTRGTYSYTTVLADIVTQKFDYIVTCDSDYNTSTSPIMVALATQISAQAQPTVGIRQRMIAGSSDTLTYVEGKAQALNNPRCEIVYGIATDFLPSSMAASWAAIVTQFEWSGNLPVNRCNFSQFPCQPNDLSYWQAAHFIPSRSGPAVAPTTTQITSLLNSGVSPLQLTTSNSIVMSKRITTYSLLNSQLDTRCRDACIVSICDAYTSDAAYRVTQQFQGNNLGTNPGQGQPVPPNTVVPQTWIGDLKSLTNLYGEQGYGLLINSAQTIAGLNVQSSGDRLSANAPLYTTPIADQWCLLVSQLS